MSLQSLPQVSWLSRSLCSYLVCCFGYGLGVAHHSLFSSAISFSRASRTLFSSSASVLERAQKSCSATRLVSFHPIRSGRVWQDRANAAALSQIDPLERPQVAFPATTGQRPHCARQSIPGVCRPRRPQRPHWRSYPALWREPSHLRYRPPTNLPASLAQRNGLCGLAIITRGILYQFDVWLSS